MAGHSTASGSTTKTHDSYPCQCRRTGTASGSATKAHDRYPCLCRRTGDDQNASRTESNASFLRDELERMGELITERMFKTRASSLNRSPNNIQERAVCNVPRRYCRPGANRENRVQYPPRQSVPPAGDRGQNRWMWHSYDASLRSRPQGRILL